MTTNIKINPVEVLKDDISKSIESLTNIYLTKLQAGENSELGTAIKDTFDISWQQIKKNAETLSEKKQIELYTKFKEDTKRFCEFLYNLELVNEVQIRPSHDGVTHSTTQKWQETANPKRWRTPIKLAGKNPQYMGMDAMPKLVVPSILISMLVGFSIFAGLGLGVLLLNPLTLATLGIVASLLAIGVVLGLGAVVVTPATFWLLAIPFKLIDSALSTIFPSLTLKEYNEAINPFKELTVELKNNLYPKFIKSNENDNRTNATTSNISTNTGTDAGEDVNIKPYVQIKDSGYTAVNFFQKQSFTREIRANNQNKSAEDSIKQYFDGNKTPH